jgi:hypothetical protein
MALFFKTSMKDVGWFALAFTTYVIGVTFGQDITIDVITKQVTQLRVNWTIEGKASPADTVELEYAKEDYPGRTSITLAKNATEFTIEDLVASTKYNVCLLTTKKGDGSKVLLFQQCREIMTIPLIRDDSIIALIVVILIVILIIGTGYCCQRHRKNRLNQKLEREEQALQAHENNVEDEEENEHPKSAIEDDQVNVRL